MNARKFEIIFEKHFLDELRLKKKTNVFIAIFINISKNAILFFSRKNIDIAASMIEFKKL